MICINDYYELHSKTIYYINIIIIFKSFVIYYLLFYVQ